MVTLFFLPFLHSPSFLPGRQAHWPARQPPSYEHEDHCHPMTEHQARSLSLNDSVQPPEPGTLWISYSQIVYATKTEAFPLVEALCPLTCP